VGTGAVGGAAHRGIESNCHGILLNSSRAYRRLTCVLKVYFMGLLWSGSRSVSAPSTWPMAVLNA